MLRTGASRILKIKPPIGVLFNHEIRAELRGLWPDPRTQPSILEFLEEINYFEEPRKVTNVGIKRAQLQNQPSQVSKDPNTKISVAAQEEISSNIDDVMRVLDEKIDVEPLNFETINEEWLKSIEGRDQLALLANHFGIYRDLLMDYNPKQGSISFTKTQADRLKGFVPFYWITDLPHSRVPLKHHPEQALKYFEPLVPIIAKFSSNQNIGTEKFSEPHTDCQSENTVYHGNIISASESGLVPSIQLNGDNLLPNDMGAQASRESCQTESISLKNFPAGYDKYLTIVLVNLDSIVPNNSILHWMVTNIKNSNKKVQFEEACKFLPTFGIRGFGYSRYVFVALEHNNPLDSPSMQISDFCIEKRLFNLGKFLQQHSDDKMCPIGLSWYQTIWDASSNAVFYNYLNMRVPEYEYVQPKLVQRKEAAYPGRVPFNLYIDRYRNPKDINKQVLLERLKTLHPFESYKDQYEKPKIPVNLHRIEGPSWMHNVVIKQRNKVGYWRGLRPASALLPLNNNADLDRPKYPLMPPSKAPVNAPNPYPGRPKIKFLRDLPYSKPVTEHPSHRVLHENHLPDSDKKKLDSGGD